jgi:hypothetical protein
MRNRIYISDKLKLERISTYGHWQGGMSLKWLGGVRRQIITHVTEKSY